MARIEGPRFGHDEENKRNDGSPDPTDAKVHSVGPAKGEPAKRVSTPRPVNETSPVSIATDKAIKEAKIEAKVALFLSSIDNSGELAQKKPLTAEDRKEIASQLRETLRYLEEGRAELVKKASNSSDGYLYITPQEQGLAKTGKFKEGGKYGGSHLQVCSDGTVYLTPKHPKLQIGKGTFKNVRLGLEESSGKLVASASVRGDTEEIQRETALIHRNHDRVAYTIYTPSGHVAKGKLIMPYAQHGDVKSFAAGGTKSEFLQKISKEQVAAGMVRSVGDQHRAGIINRDIKLENFLLAEDEGLEVWCLDRGLATLKEDQPSEAFVQGTLHYMAPEVLNMRADLRPISEDTGEKVDIYSLGVALYSLQEKHTDKMFEEEEANMLPWLSMGHVFTWSFSRKDAMQKYKAAYEGYMKKHPKFAEKGKWNALVAQMTHPDPTQRPPIEEVESALRALDQE